MVCGFYDIADLSGHPIFQNESIDEKWSPAEVNQILFRNFEDPTRAMDELLTLQPGSVSSAFRTEERTENTQTTELNLQ
jgi:hypothetical protein